MARECVWGVLYRVAEGENIHVEGRPKQNQIQMQVIFFLRGIASCPPSSWKVSVLTTAEASLDPAFAPRLPPIRVGRGAEQ